MSTFCFVKIARGDTSSHRITSLSLSLFLIFFFTLSLSIFLALSLYFTFRFLSFFLSLFRTYHALIISGFVRFPRRFSRVRQLLLAEKKIMRGAPFIVTRCTRAVRKNKADHEGREAARRKKTERKRRKEQGSGRKGSARVRTNKWSDYNVYASNLNFCDLVSGSRTARRCAAMAKTSVRCASFCQVLPLCLHKEGIASRGILFGEVFV